MGFFKKLTNLLAGGSSASSKHRILVVGLDNSGKSTILAWLKPKKVRRARGVVGRGCKWRLTCASHAALLASLSFAGGAVRGRALGVANPSTGPTDCVLTGRWRKSLHTY